MVSYFPFNPLTLGVPLSKFRCNFTEHFGLKGMGSQDSGGVFSNINSENIFNGMRFRALHS
jgi:hypothetical protein